MNKVIRVWDAIIAIVFFQIIFVSALAEPVIYVFGNPILYLNGDATGSIEGGRYNESSDNVISEESSFGASVDGHAVLSQCENGEDAGELESSIMYVTGSPFARLRADESTHNPYLAKMPYGSMVDYLSSNTVDGVMWSHIVYNGQTGYCMTKYLGTENPYDGSMPHPQAIDAAFGSNLLQRGNRYPDAHVRNLQLCLIEGEFLSDDPGADGLFGSSTQKALMKYQQTRGLDPVGRAGDTTKNRLWNEYQQFLQENGVIQ